LMMTWSTTGGGSGCRVISKCWKETLMKFRTFISASRCWFAIRLI